MPSTTLLSELRRRIRDTRRVVPSLTIATSDKTTSSALLELTNAMLIFTPTGGSVAKPFSLDLTSASYNTVGKVHQELQRMAGIVAILDQEADVEHESIDWEEFGPQDVTQVGFQLRHHVFSDWEAEQVIQGAIRRHNPTMSIQTLPPSEWELVLTLAMATIYRTQAGDTSKRKGTDAEVGELLQLASSFDDQYASDAKRLRNVIQSPKEAPNGKIQQGDVVLGHMYRKSMRNGFLAPMAAANPPPVPMIDVPEDWDPEDDNVRLRWQKSEDVYFHSYEMWMDRHPEVEREATSPVTGAARPTTAYLVFRSSGASANYSSRGFSTYIEQYGQLITRFNVASLEPETDYYFRLYATDVNFNTVASGVVKIRTKPLRTRFLKPNTTSTTTGPAGTVVTVNFDPTRAAFTAQCGLEMEGKPLVATIVNPYQVTFVVPVFIQKTTPKQLVVISPTGLRDVLTQFFTVT